MSPGEVRLLEFIETRLESLLRRPGVWGSNLSIEDQVLQLLELRRFLLDPTSKVNDTYKLMRAYTRFIEAKLEEATAEPLSVQLERLQRAAELTTLLGEFVETELAEFVADRALGEDQDVPSMRSHLVETYQRILEQTYQKSVVRVRRGARVAEAIRFDKKAG